MFQRLLTSALFAGFCAGLIAAALQLAFVQPVLLHAELYEGGDLVHFGAEAVSAHPELPGFDPVRDGMSVLFSALIYVGYGLILVAAMAMADERGVTINGRTGLIWGIAGFLAFQFAPAFSLPPEVPGVAAAELGARQVWWWGTVAATGAGLAMIGFGRGLPAWGAAAVLILAPHVIGAPHPASFAGPVPPEIAALFASRALGVGFAVWAVLGGLAGYFWQREAEGETATA
ncbi:CbtA family protein [Roseovarius indicus]|uniref:Cobalt transporter n=1 Tax=Roseovarius indicus TaxID=540747 RepID=A0A0T5P8U5_9RHOB|nr:CbtA family protein [Roseovarius indicus]KRS17603.1 cobalt transporter [Roseovarius indicus]QEW24662.1 putative cobalt transporter subunit CbtA [Roseovarius indicus]SFE27993.1 cobalt transporter subunit CbtA [Roseovarius indicus]